MNHNSIAIVFGYIPKIDKLSEIAGKHGLLQRFSIALDTYYPDNGSMFFNGKTCSLLIGAILKDKTFDTVYFFPYNNKTKEILFDTDSLLAAIQELSDDEENDCFSCIQFFLKGEMICHIETEFYTAIGGPQPYHDTYNIVFYQKEYSKKETEDLIVATCNDNDIAIRDKITGNEMPYRSIWQRLKSFL